MHILKGFDLILMIKEPIKLKSQLQQQLVMIRRVQGFRHGEFKNG